MPGPPGSPTPEEIIADTKDGVLIDGRGSYSIDQQRYNGQFGGDAFWEVKNGKKTRMVSDVTYNAITTDFWANLDAVSGKESWEMFGTTRRREGPAGADQPPVARLAMVAHSPHHGRARPTADKWPRLTDQSATPLAERRLTGRALAARLTVMLFTTL